MEIFEVGKDDIPSFDEDKFANDTVLNLSLNQSENNDIIKLLDDFRKRKTADPKSDDGFYFEDYDEEKIKAAPNDVEEPADSNDDDSFDDSVGLDHEKPDEEEPEELEDFREQPVEEENPEFLSEEELEEDLEDRLEDVSDSELEQEEQAERAAEEMIKFDEGWLAWFNYFFEIKTFQGAVI